MKLSCSDRSDYVRYVTKTRQDNNVNDHIGLGYAETENELSGPIWPGTIRSENQIRQWCNQSYRCGLHWNDIKLSWPIRLDIDYDKNQIWQLHD